MGGVVLGAIGWEWLNLVSLPLLAAMLVGSVLVGRRMARAGA